MCGREQNGQGGATSRRRRAAVWLLLAVWAALVAAFSLIPRAPVSLRPLLFPGGDKLLHGAAYAVLCGLIVWAVAAGRRWAHLAASGAAAVLFGLAVECLQPLTGRTFDWRDLAANGSGVLIALAAAAVTPPRRPGH
jgi:hypothetical protein